MTKVIPQKFKTAALDKRNIHNKIRDSQGRRENRNLPLISLMFTVEGRLEYESSPSILNFLNVF